MKGPVANMSVVFLLLGHLRYQVKDASRLVLEGKEGKSLEAVCNEIGIQYSPAIIYIVNGVLKDKEYILHPDDEVKLIALSGGG